MGHVTSFIRVWRFKHSARESGCLLHMSYNAWQTMLGYVMRDIGPAWVKFWLVLWPWNSNKNSWNDDKRQQMGWKFNSDRCPGRDMVSFSIEEMMGFQILTRVLCAPPNPPPPHPLRGFLSVIVVPSLDAAICLPKKETSQLLGLHRTCILCALEWAMVMLDS